MIRSFIIALTLLYAAGVAHADAALDRAISLQTAGEHSQAITAYQALISSRGYSPTLLYNLGLAELEAGQVGRAIVSLERARMLSPRDAAIRSLLARAQARAQLDTGSYSFRDKLAATLSVREWAFAALFGCGLLCAGVLLLGLQPLARRRSAALITAGAITASAALLGFHLTSEAFDRAIVLEQGTVARQSPFERATALFSLSAGESVRVERRQANYVYVQNRSGARGWVPAERVTHLRASAGDHAG